MLANAPLGCANILKLIQILRDWRLLHNFLVLHVCHTGVTVRECFMASLRKRGERWQVQIRRQNATPISKSFISKARARAWALKTEALIEEGGLEQRQSCTKHLGIFLLGTEMRCPATSEAPSLRYTESIMRSNIQ